MSVYEVVNNYNGFIQELFKNGFYPFTNMSKDKIDDKHFYRFGAVGFIERDNELYSVYISLHNSTVTGEPDSVFMFEYPVNQYGPSRKVRKAHVNHLGQLASEVVKMFDLVKLNVGFNNMEFITFERVDSAIFKDDYGVLHNKPIMYCEQEITH